MYVWYQLQKIQSNSEGSRSIFTYMYVTIRKKTRSQPPFHHNFKSSQLRWRYYKWFQCILGLSCSEGLLSWQPLWTFPHKLFGEYDHLHISSLKTVQNNLKGVHNYFTRLIRTILFVHFIRIQIPCSHIRFRGGVRSVASVLLFLIVLHFCTIHITHIHTN